MTTTVAAILGGLLGGVIVVIAGRWLVRPVTAPGPAGSRKLPDEGDVPADVLRDAVDVLPAGVIVVSPADEVVLANEAALGLHAVRGRRLGRPDLSRLARDVRTDMRRVTTELEHPGATGRQSLKVAAEPVGAEGYVVIFLEDTTEARRLDDVRRDFVANVSHELKTPVGALVVLAEAIQHSAAEPDVVERFSGRMVHEATRLARLVQELIALSRLEGAEAMPPAVAVPVAGLVQDATDRVRLAADARRIQIVTGGDVDAVVAGDRDQLVTALSNLLDNAIAYSPEGTTVSVGAQRRDGEVELSVKDEGIGISPDDTERIFERFYRADPARSRQTGGTGLGLAIVKHIMANHGGRVTVWSAEGLGSTFTLVLPLMVPSPDVAR